MSDDHEEARWRLLVGEVAKADEALKAAWDRLAPVERKRTELLAAELKQFDAATGFCDLEEAHGRAIRALQEALDAANAARPQSVKEFNFDVETRVARVRKGLPPDPGDDSGSAKH